MPRHITFSPAAWEDYEFFLQDKRTLLRINRLIKEISRTPFQGIGKPEPLRENLSGYWSRRIDDTNRIVYAVTESAILVASLRYHYHQ